MPPIRINKFSNETTSIARNNNVINISNSKRLYRRNSEQKEDITNNNKLNPTPVSSIPTITISPGPVSFTLITSATPTDISATTIDTDINSTDTATNINATPNTDIPATNSIGIPGTIIPTDTLTPGVPLPSIPTITSIPIITPLKSDTLFVTAPIQTQNPSSIFSTTTTSSSSSSVSSSQPIPSSGSSNNRSHNLNVLIFPILAAVLLFIIVLTILGLIYRKRKRNANNNQRIVSTGDVTENGSKSNSLTSSINSISSSFKIKKGKVVPEDIIGSHPAPIVDNKDENDENEKPKTPILKRTLTTVSAFQELVDLTDDEHKSLRQSTSSGIFTIASRLSSTPTYINYDPEEGSSRDVAISLHQERIGSSRNVVIPLHQERIDYIPYPTASSSGNGTRNFASSNDENDNQ
ncbi:hypothetical protein C1645_785131 [Glomus cerebriforme]|uniref:Uncharacterized protein n=1 Tax=Glomus cerebriforme TaxID=658196 RepID=A0A397SCG9_9GLOM|nr:hypothetical protein C1645_785131 [Glomus cerebriforme]